MSVQFAEEGTPRRGVETDPVRELATQLADLRKQLAALGKSASLRNASISGGDGLAVKDEGSNIRLRVSPEEGAILAYDGTGAVVARYGLLAYSDPGEYGLETLTDNGWSHVGAGVADWASMDGKPATFPAALPIPGSGVSGAVASASTAGLAQQAEGSQYAYDNNVGGTSWFAVYVGNNGGYKFGRNTSSARYKENIRDFTGDVSDLMAIRPVLFDRKDTLDTPPMVDGIRAEGPVNIIRGNKDEYGFIAEEMLEVWPEVVQWFDHGDGNGPVVDGIRYEMIGARLVPILQGLLITARTAARKVGEVDARVTAVEDAATAAVLALRARVKKLEDADAANKAALAAQDKLIQDLTDRIEAMT